MFLAWAYTLKMMSCIEIENYEVGAGLSKKKQMFGLGHVMYEIFVRYPSGVDMPSKY